MAVELPPEVLLQIANHTDPETFISLVSVPEIRERIGGFLKFFTDEGPLQYFSRLKAIKHRKLTTTSKISPYDFNLIEIQHSLNLNNDILMRSGVDEAHGIMVILDYDNGTMSRYGLTKALIQLKNMSIFLPNIKNVSINAGGCDETSVINFDTINFDPNIIQELTFESIFNYKSSKKFNLPNLEVFKLSYCSSLVTDLIDTETFSNLTVLSIYTSEFYESSEGFVIIEDIIFKNLKEATFYGISKLKNVEFPLLKKGNFGISSELDQTSNSLSDIPTTGENSYFENVYCPEMEEFSLITCFNKPFPIIKNIYIPKVQKVSLNASWPMIRPIDEFYKSKVMESLSSFRHVKEWRICNNEYLEIKELCEYIQKLEITVDNTSETRLLDFPNLEHFSIVYCSFEYGFPKFNSAPNLTSLTVYLDKDIIWSNFNEIPEIYPNIQTLSIQRNIFGENIIPVYIPKFEKLRKLIIIGELFDFEPILDDGTIIYNLDVLEELIYTFPFMKRDKVFTSIDLNLPNLKKITLKNIDDVKDLNENQESTIKISRCPQLQELIIDKVNFIELDNKIGKSLKIIRTSENTNLKGIKVDSLPHIQEIDYHTKETNSILKSVDVNSTAVIKCNKIIS